MSKPPSLDALRDPKNSLLYWYPKVQKLGIPTPKTEWVIMPSEIARKALEAEDEKDKGVPRFRKILDEIKKVAKSIGYPVVIRTDIASAKHDWEKAAFVRFEREMDSHVFKTIEHNEMADMLGLNYGAMVVREFLELDWRFKAFFGNMPVARERRYFVKDGSVLCRHPYWIEESIQDAHKDNGIQSELLGYRYHRLPNQWQILLAQLNTQTEDEVRVLIQYAYKIANDFEGYWSVDFACTRDGKWVLIDMANGYASYHPLCSKELVEEKK